MGDYSNAQDRFSKADKAIKRTDCEEEMAKQRGEKNQAVEDGVDAKNKNDSDVKPFDNDDKKARSADEGTIEGVFNDEVDDPSQFDGK